MLQVTGGCYTKMECLSQFHVRSTLISDIGRAEVFAVTRRRRGASTEVRTRQGQPKLPVGPARAGSQEMTPTARGLRPKCNSES